MAKIWETAYAKYVQDIDRFEKDKLHIFWLVVGQMWSNQTNRIKETDIRTIRHTGNSPHGQPFGSETQPV